MGLISVSDVPLVIYLHGGYWQFLRYGFVCSHRPLNYSVDVHKMGSFSLCQFIVLIQQGGVWIHGCSTH